MWALPGWQEEEGGGGEENGGRRREGGRRGRGGVGGGKGPTFSINKYIVGDVLPDPLPHSTRGSYNFSDPTYPILGLGEHSFKDNHER